jgi:hypothetical protein
MAARGYAVPTPCHAPIILEQALSEILTAEKQLSGLVVLCTKPVLGLRRAFKGLFSRLCPPGEVGFLYEFAYKNVTQVSQDI